MITKTQAEAPLIAIVGAKTKTTEYRLYRWHYYSNRDCRGKKITHKDDPKNGDYIQVGKQAYRKLCPKNELCITVSSNLMFGNWLSVGIEERHSGKYNSPFTKENFEKIMAESRARVEKFDKKIKGSSGKKTYFSYHKIRWCNNG